MNDGEPATLYCSFCLRSQDEVAKLVAGPGRLFICDNCVAAAADYMAGRTPDLTAYTPAEALPSEHLLAQLSAIEDTLQGKGNQLQWVVGVLRGRDISWAQIGAALGISRQSAWERFS